MTGRDLPPPTDEPRPGADASAVLRWAAAAIPDRIAIEAADEHLSYCALDARVERLAGWLHQQDRDGSGPQTSPVEPRVAMWIGGGVAAVIASLAVLRAGMISVPIDPTTPASRVAHIAQRVGACVVLTDVDPRAGLGVAAVDPLHHPDPGARPAARMPPASLMSIVFTSGTTGAPKGILLPAAQRPALAQDGLAAFRRSGEAHAGDRAGSDDERAMRIGLAWAGTVGNVELLLQRLMLMAGTLVIFDLRRQGVVRLGRWLREERVYSCFTLPPTVLRHLLASLTAGEVLAELRFVSLTGEAVDWADIAQLRSHLAPEAVVYNAYGLSETGLISGIAVLADTPIGEGRLPAGWPAPGRELQIVGEDGAPLQPGEVGEVTVTAADLALGYWDEDELSAETFQTLTDGRRRMRTGDRGWLREDGALQLAGRLDHMVKIAANRVELGDVEHALRALPGVEQGAATTYTDAAGSVRLIAFVTLTPDADIDPRRLRAAAGELLPAASLPDRIEVLDAIPQLAGGKIDRRSLPTRAPAVVELVADQRPRSPLERELAEIWAAILGVDAVGLDDDFFSLGGDSLRAAQVIGEIERRLALDRPISLMLGAPTLRSLAAVLEREQAWSDLVALRPGGNRPPLFLIHDHFGSLFPLRAVTAGIAEDQPVYGLQGELRPGATPPEATLELLCARYVAQISAFCPSGPYQLYGNGVGGLIAFEMALQLEAQGAHVSFLGIGDVVGPLPGAAPWHRWVCLELAQLRGASPAQATTLLVRQARFVAHRARRAAAGRHRAPTVPAPTAAPDASTALLGADRAQAAHEHYRRLAAAYFPRRRLRTGATLIDTMTDRGWRPHVRGPLRFVEPEAMLRSLALDPSGRSLPAAARSHGLPRPPVRQTPHRG